MGTQKILASKEVRTFHHACQVYTWVDPVEKGLNLQPGLVRSIQSISVNSSPLVSIVSRAACKFLMVGSVEVSGSMALSHTLAKA